MWKKCGRAAKYFEGEHDFKAFKASGTSSKSTVRTIYKAEVKQDGERIIIEYDGKKFGGWQKQPTKLNIQGEIEQAIKEITGETVELNASGRTDSGVHSLGQTANFKTNSNIEIGKMAIAINSKLKKSIVIKSAEEVDENFHARYCCKGKKLSLIHI